MKSLPMKKNINESVAFQDRYCDASMVKPVATNDKLIDHRLFAYISIVYVRNMPGIAPNDTTIKLIYFENKVEQEKKKIWIKQ